MLLVDQNEVRNHPTLVPLLAQSIEVDVGGINQSPGSTLIYPDFVIWGGEKLVGINRKTVGEVLSSIDACIEQVQRELAGPCEHLALIVEGIMVADPEGMYAYSPEWSNAKLFGSTRGSVPFSYRFYHVNPKHIANELTRLEFLGVQILFTYSLADTVTKLVALHDMVLKGEPNNVLNKLRKADIHVQGLTPQETQFAKLLMSAGANWGEELALTVSACFSSVGELFNLWSEGGTLADLMLRGGTRRVGNAAEKRLQSALGYSRMETHEPAREEVSQIS